MASQIPISNVLLNLEDMEMDGTAEKKREFVGKHGSIREFILVFFAHLISLPAEAFEFCEPDYSTSGFAWTSDEILSGNQYTFNESTMTRLIHAHAPDELIIKLKEAGIAKVENCECFGNTSSHALHVAMSTCPSEKLYWLMNTIGLLPGPYCTREFITRKDISFEEKQKMVEFLWNNYPKSRHNDLTDCLFASDYIIEVQWFISYFMDHGLGCDRGSDIIVISFQSFGIALFDWLYKQGFSVNYEYTGHTFSGIFKANRSSLDKLEAIRFILDRQPYLVLHDKDLAEAIAGSGDVDFVMELGRLFPNAIGHEFFAELLMPEYDSKRLSINTTKVLLTWGLTRSDYIIPHARYDKNGYAIGGRCDWFATYNWRFPELHDWLAKTQPKMQDAIRRKDGRILAIQGHK